MFKEKLKELGTVKAKQRIKVIFEADQPLEVLDLTSSCGCSTPVMNKEKNKVIVVYTPGDIPYQLLLEGKNSYESVKTVTVKYSLGGVTHVETLTFKANVVR